MAAPAGVRHHHHAQQQQHEQQPMVDNGGGDDGDDGAVDEAPEVSSDDQQQQPQQQHEPQQHHQSRQRRRGGGGGGAGGVATSPTKLIVNYIPEEMTQAALHSLFATMGKIESCKLIANRGYGFVEFADAGDAARARAAFDGLLMQNKTLKVSHALLHPEAKPPPDPEADWNLYMCNLPEDMTLQRLHAIFARYGRIVNSRIAAGIAFVLYERRADAERAIAHANGCAPDGFAHPLVVKFANRPNPNRQPYGHNHGHNHSAAHRHAAMAAAAPPYGGGWAAMAPTPPGGGGGGVSHAWSIYVYNLAADVDELTLWQLFGPYGAIVSVRVVKDRQTGRGRGFAFVTMRSFEQAAAAIRDLNGYALMGQPLSVSFKTHKR